MANKYLERNVTTGQITEVEATDVSAGAGDAGEVVALDAGGLIDPTMLPPTTGVTFINVLSAVALTANDLVYIDSSGEADLADGAVAGFAACGFVTATVGIGVAVDVFFEGINIQAGMTPGARQYLSDSTPGAITATPVAGTGKLHQFVGKALSATQLLFEPDDAILLA